MSIKFKHYRYPDDLSGQAILFIPKKADMSALRTKAITSGKNKVYTYSEDFLVKSKSYGSCALYIPNISEASRLSWTELDTLKNVGIKVIYNAGNSFSEGILDKAKSTTTYKTASAITNETISTFQDVSPRSFNFQYTFMPTSKEESKEISEIVNFFRWHALPDYGGITKGEATISIPAVWDIQIIGLGDNYRNTILFKTAVLTGITTNYGEGGYLGLMKDNTPQKITMSMDFTEIKKPMKSDFKEWFKEE